MITWFFVTLVLTVTGWISWKVRPRRRPEPVAWVPAPEPDESEPYAAEKLRELGLDHLIERPHRRSRPW